MGPESTSLLQKAFGIARVGMVGLRCTHNAYPSCSCLAKIRPLASRKQQEEKGIHIFWRQGAASDAHVDPFEAWKPGAVAGVPVPDEAEARLLAGGKKRPFSPKKAQEPVGRGEGGSLPGSLSSAQAWPPCSGLSPEALEVPVLHLPI